MTETIVELCCRLPESEANLRARWSEFGEELTRSVGIIDFFMYPVGHIAAADDIRTAKVATDKLIRHGFSFIVETDQKPGYLASLHRNADRNRKNSFITVRASTEEMARAAVALLAAVESEGEKK